MHLGLRGLLPLLHLFRRLLDVLSLGSRLRIQIHYLSYRILSRGAGIVRCILAGAQETIFGVREEGLQLRYTDSFYRYLFGELSFLFSSCPGL